MHIADTSIDRKKTEPPAPPPQPEVAPDPQLGLRSAPEQDTLNAVLRDTADTVDAAQPEIPEESQLAEAETDLQTATRRERDAVATAADNLARAERTLDGLPTDFGPVRDALETEVEEAQDALTEAELELDVAEAQHRVRSSNGSPPSIAALDEARAALTAFRNPPDVHALADEAETLLDGPVSVEDATELFGLFDGLGAKDANALFEELDSRGLTEDLFLHDHIVPPHVRSNYYDTLAGTLDADNLIGVVDQLKELGNFAPGFFAEEGPNDFINAIAENASDDVKLDFIGQLAEADRLEVEGGGVLDSIAVARLIGSLANTPDRAVEALELLSDEQLETIINASTIDLDPPGFENAYGDLAHAVANIDASDPGNAALVTQFFDVSLQQFENDGPRHIGRDLPLLRDGLTDVFTNHFGTFIGQSVDGSGAIENEFATQIESFAEHVLFAAPPGERQQEAATFLSDQLGGWMDTATNGDPEGTVTVNGVTLRRQDLANLTGQVLAHTLEGLDSAIGAAESNAEMNAAAVSFLVNLAFDLTPGLDTAEDVVNTIFGSVKSKTKSEVIEELTGSGADIDTHDLDQLYLEIRDGIGGGATSTVDPDLADIRDAFEGGFTGVRPVD